MSRLIRQPLKTIQMESDNENHPTEEKKKIKPCIVKVSPMKENKGVSPPAQNSIEVPSDSEDSDSGDEHNEEKQMKKFLKARNRMQKTKEGLLKELAIVESTAEVRKAMQKEKAHKAAKRRASQNKFKTEAPPPVKRRSLRIQNKDPAGADLPVELVPMFEKDPRVPGTEFPMVGIGFDNRDKLEHASEDKLDKVLNSYDEYDHFMESLSNMRGITDDIFEKPECLPLEGFSDRMKSMKISENHVQKVTKSRIFSVAVHPSITDILVAAGDKEGYLGLWKPMLRDSNDGCYAFKPHIRPISCLKFNTSNCNKLYMCSYDGILRTMDLEKTVFDEAFIDDENTAMSGFDFMDYSTLVTSHDNRLSIIDTRMEAKGKAVRTFEIHNRVAKCVSCHPLQTYCVTTSHRDGSVFIFDIRNASKNVKPIVELKGHSRSTSSSYFSPVTGKCIVTTSYDNHLRVFDTSVITGEHVKMKASCYHNNQTGRWLSSFRATWHPRTDDVFVVGSMNRPRQVDIYGSTAKPLHILSEPEVLTSIVSVNSFHPTRDILACGNSSGKIFMFSAELSQLK